MCVTLAYIVYGFVWFWLYPIGNWGNNLVINVVALLTTYALPWAFALRLLVMSKKHQVEQVPVIA